MRSDLPFRSRVLVTFAFGAGIGALDAAVGVWNWQRELSLLIPWLFLVSSLAAATAVGATWAVLCVPWKRRPQVAALAAFGAVAGAWLALFVVTAVRGWIPPVQIVLAAASGLVGVALAASFAGDGGSGRVLRTSAFVAWGGVATFLCALMVHATGQELFVALAVLAALAIHHWTRCDVVARRLLCAAPFLLVLAALTASLSGGDVVPQRNLVRSGRAPDAPRRVIFLVIDTLRADALSCLDAAAPATPAIDAFANETLVFRDARSPAPWTLPAMASMMTGCEPRVHGATQPETALSPEIPTLADGLAQLGYRTAAIGENSILRPSAGLARGFDQYDWFPRFRPEPPLATWLLNKLGGPPTRHHLDPEELTDRALAWCEEHAAEDFFLWLHYFDPHSPYRPPTAFAPQGPPPAGAGRHFNRLADVRSGHYAPNAEQRAWIRELYDAEVRWTDAEIGRLFGGLHDMQLWDDTLIVLTSDHGEEFWEHGGFEHGHTMYEELLRVPLLVRLPGARATGDVLGPVSTASLAPTLLTLCGSESPAERRTEPLLPLAAGTATPRAIASSGMLYYEPKEALLDGSDKYIGSLVTDSEVAYDLGVDPGEQRPVETPAQIERLRALLEQTAATANAVRAKLDVSEQRAAIDGADAADLRALGYLGE